MKQTLQLRVSQNLTMMPQLQQAIKLLQLSTLDLQQEIQQALESNMMLEVDEEIVNIGENTTTKNDNEISNEASQTNIPDELPIDSGWDDVFENTLPSSNALSEMSELETQHSKVITLNDYLLQQLDIISISERDRAIAIAIIDAINKDGYLNESIENIYQDLRSQLKDLEFNEIEAVLHRVQNFEPIGVAAKNLSDCLLIQLKQLSKTVPFRNRAIEVVKRHLDLLATHSQAKLMRRLGFSEIQFREVLALIRTLNPKPGADIQGVEFEYIVPDLLVNKKNTGWQVNLNPDIAPKLRVNTTYSKMIKRVDNSRDNVNMKEHLQEAKWFIKSLHNRNDTLLRVAKSIVKRQKSFFEHGAIAMKPMVLRDIAEELDLHESTISRITTHKYMHTPNGIVELKYFFSSHVSTENGGECSATAIRAFIKKLVENENSLKPLSDNKISGLLKEKGINVARRTISKYREAMFISPSSQRKRLI